jgi:hypothetical protein
MRRRQSGTRILLTCRFKQLALAPNHYASYETTGKYMRIREHIHSIASFINSTRGKIPLTTEKVVRRSQLAGNEFSGKGLVAGLLPGSALR